MAWYYGVVERHHDLQNPTSREKIRLLGLRPITGNFISQSSVVRHDADQLAEAIIRLINRQARSPLWPIDFLN